MERNWATGAKFIGAAFVHVPSMRYPPSVFSGYFRMTEQNIVVNRIGSRVNRLDIFNRWSLGKNSVGENYYTIRMSTITLAFLLFIPVS